ncbi:MULTISPECIES: DUF2059 domain-containing protein [unclassified Mucilaginibacter]|uniref:DUF2059 domain-containing protein n=1 Tax=unclassified Mucilaginibacter TaxID=2617802 RepID=UPI002AC8C069|nr:MULTISPECIES: DUF2059 domain-containing protein [unclassified Mucilaginibacter]MEB0260840.1 DUF2059 domain-containing protein [Mucilaginibacter sp. 10I4]MEB0278430.1 DUF2059 domain-containing protein [Mucilaginibacter sp. 10B2]MEB0301875.1 DUF2059 domain-containing protein [Mucilaginibacter sp. 5C4]WPX24075.1 DUF2059 domain-containing protein [Mucilaginibacter sp. 5C4]
MKYKFLIIALLMCGAAKAQTPAITPAHLKAAEAVLTASGAGKQLKENMSAMVTQASANVPEDKKPKFIEIMNTFTDKYMNWDLMKDQIAALYAQEFTEKELKDLAVFYRSPLGIKINQKQPALFQKGAAIGQQAVQSHQAELQQMMQEAFKTP